MNYRILLNLVTIPPIASSMLTMGLMPGLARAAETITSTTVQTSCNAANPETSFSETSLVSQSSAAEVAAPIEISLEYPVMDFSATESDAAVALFGCDCPPCINALRQLRGQLSSQVLLSSSQGLSSNSQGHCWTKLQQRTTPEEVQEVLQGLEAEANS